MRGSCAQALAMMASLSSILSADPAVVKYYFGYIVFFASLLFSSELYGRLTGRSIEEGRGSVRFRHAVLFALYYFILIWGEFGVKPFIYFKF